MNCMASDGILPGGRVAEVDTLNSLDSLSRMPARRTIVCLEDARAGELRGRNGDRALQHRQRGAARWLAPP